MPKQIAFTRTVQKAGRLDALCVYFKCKGEGALSITSGPVAARAAHWGFRLLRLPKGDLAVGDVINIELDIEGSIRDLNCWRWRWSLRDA